MEQSYLYSALLVPALVVVMVLIAVIWAVCLIQKKQEIGNYGFE
ncbi:hypothetical protein [Acinetobacter pittii]|nr:hypothetical protein [Acinetobacter pittii]